MDFIATSWKLNLVNSQTWWLQSNVDSRFHVAKNLTSQLKEGAARETLLGSWPQQSTCPVLFCFLFLAFVKILYVNIYRLYTISPNYVPILAFVFCRHEKNRPFKRMTTWNFLLVVELHSGMGWRHKNGPRMQPQGKWSKPALETKQEEPAEKQEKSNEENWDDSVTEATKITDAKRNSLWIKRDQSTLSDAPGSWRSMRLPGSGHTEVTANLNRCYQRWWGKSHVGVGWIHTERVCRLGIARSMPAGAEKWRERRREAQAPGLFSVFTLKTLKYVDMSSSGLCDSEMYYFPALTRWENWCSERLKLDQASHSQ